MAVTEPTLPLSGFSSRKRAILVLLKGRGSIPLAEIARALGISKVASLRHLSILERDHLVERSNRTNGVGRPRAHFQLSSGSTHLFPEAYTHMSLAALAFIEERLGRNSVVTLLQQRAHEIHDQHEAEFQTAELKDRVRTLARVRDEGGYMAEVGTQRKQTLELLEHNCPILAIAGRYPEACEVERRMFEGLLRAKVETSHRVVAGDAVCRFLIRPKEGLE